MRPSHSLTLLASVCLLTACGSMDKDRQPATLQSLAKAELSVTPDEVEGVSETQAIKAALGDAAKRAVINSTKGATGHLLGGAGGLESVFTVLALHHQISPPTINIFNQDPECDLDYCANTARDLRIDVALKNNFGFGGTNGSLVFKKI